MNIIRKIGPVEVFSYFVVSFILGGMGWYVATVAILQYFYLLVFVNGNFC